MTLRFAAPLTRGEASLRAGGLLLENPNPPLRLRLTTPLSGGQSNARAFYQGEFVYR